MVAKLATLGLIKIKVFWNKGYDVIVSVHDVINRILLHGSNYIVDVVMWPKFDNSSISMKEVMFCKDLTKKTMFLRDALGSSSIIWDWHKVWPWNFTQVWQKGCN